MIIDSLENASKYNSLHAGFAAAFEWIKGQDLQTIADGTYPIAEGLKAIVSDKKGKTAAESLEKFECHNKAIDIQLCIRGTETIGWKPRSKCQDSKGGYNPEKDVTFFNETPDMYFGLTNNQFGIFFPEDVHAPMIGEDLIKKLVVKVKI